MARRLCSWRAGWSARLSVTLIMACKTPRVTLLASPVPSNNTYAIHFDLLNEVDAVTFLISRQFTGYFNLIAFLQAFTKAQ